MDGGVDVFGRGFDVEIEVVVGGQVAEPPIASVGGDDLKARQAPWHVFWHGRANRAGSFIHRL
jgi:hypothetical protein